MVNEMLQEIFMFLFLCYVKFYFYYIFNIYVICFICVLYFYIFHVV